jgi:hypothetical protein
MNFNDAQIRYIVATFQYMDEILENSFRVAAGEANNRALCPQYFLDLMPEQQAALKPELASFRRKLRQFLKEQEIGVEPATSATNAFKAAIGFVDISLEEIRPSRLNGYGSLSQGGATEISHLIRELKQITARMMAICDTTHSESH